MNFSPLFQFWKGIEVMTLQEAISECSVDNWDGYGAEPIPQENIDAARQFEPLIVGIPFPEWGADPDGMLCCDWSNGKDRTLSISISPAGACIYAWMIAYKKGSGVLEPKPRFKSFPKTFEKIIREIFEI